MRNLFNKKEVPAIVAVEQPTVKGNYPPEVMQIHREFEGAADALLKSAKEIIDEAATKDVVKVSRLESLGFKQAAQVSELKPLIQKAELSKEQIDLVKYYQRNYPLNKFITEDQVKEICHKYNLVCGEVGRFKGFVPEKNLKQIEGFNLKKEDKDVLIFTCEYTGEAFFFDNNDFTAHGKNYCVNNGNRFYIVNSQGENIYKGKSLLTEKALLKFIGKITPRGFYGKLSNNATLKICAPVKDMDLTGLELVEGYKLQKKHIPDPVVLNPVKGGYLILTAWGDEASDPIVTNSINN